MCPLRALDKQKIHLTCTVVLCLMLMYLTRFIKRLYVLSTVNVILKAECVPESIFHNIHKCIIYIFFNYLRVFREPVINFFTLVHFAGSFLDLPHSCKALR